MARKPDPAAIETDKIIIEIEKRLREEYKQAENEIAEKLKDYWRRYEIKDKTWQRWVKEGKKTESEYRKWRTGQLAIGQRWEEMRQTIAQDLLNTNKIAKSIAQQRMGDVYAINHDYATFEVERGSLIDTSYTLYNHDTAARIMRDNPQMLPSPGKKLSQDILDGKAIRWNNNHIQSVAMQAIFQGESIPEIARRLAKTVCSSDMKAATRNARTMMTSAQNAGRYDAFRRAEEKGIEMQVMWRATLDMRTRHTHRVLDGQRRNVGEPFDVDNYKILYPGQLEKNEITDFPQSMLWNCRCTLQGVVKGLEKIAEKYRSDKAIEGMSYEEWKQSRKEKPKPIRSQEKRGNAIRSRYIKEYRDG